MKSSRIIALLLALSAVALLVSVCLVGAVGFWLVARAAVESVAISRESLSSRIAFVGNDGNLWLASPDEDQLEKITTDARGYQFPTWAPDGSRLAFIGPDDKGNSALFVSEGARDASRILFNSPRSAPFYVYWSPDSRSVSFLTQEASSLAMRLADAENPEADRIMAQGAPFYWVWSPAADQAATESKAASTLE